MQRIEIKYRDVLRWKSYQIQQKLISPEGQLFKGKLAWLWALFYVPSRKSSIPKLSTLTSFFSSSSNFPPGKIASPTKPRKIFGILLNARKTSYPFFFLLSVSGPPPPRKLAHPPKNMKTLPSVFLLPRVFTCSLLPPCHLCHMSHAARPLQKEVPPLQKMKNFQFPGRLQKGST